MKKRVQSAVDFLQTKISKKPEIALILGSGLGVLADEVEQAVVVPYASIPNFPVSTVEGHDGEFIFGTLQGVEVVVMKGRFHFYEGYEMNDVTLPVRVFGALGIEKIIVTNAAGAVNTSYKPGDFMVINDHINNLGTNALIGQNEKEWGPRFPDMSTAYDPAYIEIAHRVANTLNITHHVGVYCANTGPTYETPAEIRMMRVWGADAVGMSTVPEVTVARHMGMRILGISCISNMAAGILPQPLTHDEVMEIATQVRGDFLALVRGILVEL
ncbi:MAG: purine-nucleoside phosphorylase [Bacilli bacterium]